MSYKESVGNKLYDVINLLDSLHGPLGYSNPRLLLQAVRVAKHALIGIKEDLCQECAVSQEIRDSWKQPLSEADRALVDSLRRTSHSADNLRRMRNLA